MDWSEFLSALAGALFGALAAFSLGLLVERRKEQAENEAHVTNFLLDMATRRGFVAEPGSEWASRDDAQRLEGAVQSLRKSTRAVRIALKRPPLPATQALIEITRSCNEYLETVENSQDGARDLAPLHRLLDELTESARGLHDAIAPNSRDFARPGSLAYRAGE